MNTLNVSDFMSAEMEKAEHASPGTEAEDTRAGDKSCSECHVKLSREQVFFCIDCQVKILCINCSTPHVRIRHNTVDTHMTPTTVCQTHFNINTVFCKTCHMVICTFCIVKNHKKHDFEDLSEVGSLNKDAAIELLNESEDMLKCVYKREFECSTAAAIHQSIKIQLNKQLQLLKTNIIERVDLLISETENSFDSERALIVKCEKNISDSVKLADCDIAALHAILAQSTANIALQFDDLRQQHKSFINQTGMLFILHHNRFIMHL